MHKDKIYFSQQGMLSNMCAVHAVNNLIGATFFSQQSFDDICNFLQKQTRSLGLDIRNRHIIGGDYDANVILKAVQNCGLTTKWIDSRQKFKYEYQQGTIPKGYIINIRQKQNVLKKFLKLSDRHWICLKLQGMDWYLLDSKKEEPQIVEDIEGYINSLLRQGSQVIEIRVEVNKNQEQQSQLNRNEEYPNQQLKNQEKQKSIDNKEEEQDEQKQKQTNEIDLKSEQKQKQNKTEKNQQKINNLQQNDKDQQNKEKDITKQGQENQKDQDNKTEQQEINIQ